MEYKLHDKSTNDISNILETVLHNRGIDNVHEFLNISKANQLDYALLDNMQSAVDCFMQNIEFENNVHIVVDPDADGYCSAAMVYRYIKKLAPSVRVTYSIHAGKKHGLTDDIIISDDTHLIIIPDASSSDYEQHKYYWHGKGMDIIVLDHHMCDEYSGYALVVNNQMSPNYSNKSLSGAGVVYKFLQAVDDELWHNDADTYLDLVAVANIGDVMDSRSLETRYLMTEGLKRIKSNAIKALHNKVEDRAGSLNLISVAFYIVPLINAMIRAGTQEQKDLMFRSFCEEDVEFDYKKRDGSIVKETIHERMARECVNAKSRQDRLKLKVTETIRKHIERNNLADSRIILCCVDDMVTNELTGLIATEIAKVYKRPALLYRTRNTDEGVICSGSGRNYGGHELTDLRSMLLETGLFESVEGHPNAFGMSFAAENIDAIVRECNKVLQNYSAHTAHEVDFVIEFDDLEDSAFYEMDKLKHIWGQKVDEPSFAILNVNTQVSDIAVKNNTVRFEADGITFIRFKASEDDRLMVLRQEFDDDWDARGARADTSNIDIDVVGRIGYNSFGGVKRKQVVVSDWAIRLTNPKGCTPK